MEPDNRNVVILYTYDEFSNMEAAGSFANTVKRAINIRVKVRFMKKALLFLIIFMLILPTVVSAYELNKSYRIDKEYILVGVDCIGVDSQENIYLKTVYFERTAILVYSKNGDFSHSINIPTSGTFYFKVDEYVWVAVVREDTLLKYSLDGLLLQATDIDEEEYREYIKDIEYKYVIKNGITYTVKGSLGLFSVWKEQDGKEEKMFSVSIKHVLLHVLFLHLALGFVFLVIYGLYKFKFEEYRYR